MTGQQKAASKAAQERYKAETGKNWMTNPVCHGELGFASWDYQTWLEEQVEQLEKDKGELLREIIEHLKNQPTR